MVGVCEAQELGRHEWSISRVVTNRIQHDLSASAQTLGQQLGKTNGSRFSGGTTVSKLAQTLSAIGIATVVDRNSLEDENVSPDDDPIRMPTANISLGQGVAVALGELNLGWTISKHGESVLIASRSRIEEELFTVTCDVTHLCATADMGEPLLDVISSSIEPDSWDEVGGPGSLRLIEVRGRVLLVVANDYHVQTSLIRLLNSLRRMGGTGPFLNLQRTTSVSNRNSNQSSSVAGSTPVAMPTAPKKRGIALPDSKSMGPYGGFGGGMAGGMF